MKLKKKFSDWWFYVPILILGVHFIYRLIDQSKIIKMFPLDITNDISAYMAHLFFLKTCGFLSSCSYWYDGITTFTTIPPGWFFFTYPIYSLTENILLSTFISHILIYLIAFIIIYFLGRLHNISPIKRIALFLLFYGNAIAVGNFIRLMRIHELFALVFSTAIILLALYYKDKKLDNYSLFFIPLYSIVILSHPTIAIMASLVLFSLFLVKSFKERIQLSLIVVSSFILTSFWWIPYLKGFSQTIGTSIATTKNLLIFTKDLIPQNIASFIVPIIFLVIFYIYYRQEKSKKELLFYLPFIIVSLLMITRLTPFIPILKYVYPDSQMHFLLFLSIFMFIKIRKESWYKLKSLIPIGLILISVISIGVNEFYTPKFREYTSFEQDTIKLFSYMDGKYIMIGKTPVTSYTRAYTCYGPIFYNLTTSDGWGLPKKDYDVKLKSLYNDFNDKKCDDLKKDLTVLKTEYLITFDEDCTWIKDCSLKHIKTENKACLYKNEM